MRIRHYAILAAAALAAGCAEPGGYRPRVEGGDAGRGAEAIRRHECGACHRIPGILGARGSVGPTLEHFRRRVYIAGRYPNTPRYLVPWIRNAPAHAPATAMPDLDVGAAEARDIAAYLYSLE